MKDLIKKLLRLQHQYLPMPIFIYKNLFRWKIFHKFFYKYFLLCFDTDLNHKKPNTFEFNQKYWLSKRALYWHYAHLHHNRFSDIFENIYKNHKYLFENKKICDFMAGLGVYYLDKKFLNLTFIEGNKYCCDFLKKNYPNSRIANGDWEIIKDYKDSIDTLILTSGCLIYLDSKEIEDFFKITSKIKNFIIIHEGTDLDDFTFEYSGHTYYNLERRLKKYNINFNNSKIYSDKTKFGKIFRYFIFTS